jgi:sterol desaturase/sphingolipid hydroxylase (fatty acid hydroxylase superfamily)
LIAVAATLAVSIDPLLAVAALFVVLAPFEKLFPRHRQKVRRPHLATDVGFALLAGPLGVVSVVVGIIIGVLCLAWLPGLALRPLVTALPDVGRLMIGFVLFDLVAYWVHRLSHTIAFLWRFHQVHHSTETLDWVSGFRVHPLDGALAVPPVVLLLAAGFSPEASGALAIAQLVVGLFLHANVRWRLRPLQRIVATPEFHHWHHERGSEAHNTNFGAFLPLWDQIWGTYCVPNDRRPERYGVDPALPAGVVAQLWYPLRGLRNPLRDLRHPVRGVRHLAAALRRGAGQVRLATRRPSVESSRWP